MGARKAGRAAVDVEREVNWDGRGIRHCIEIAIIKVEISFLLRVILLAVPPSLV